MDFGKYLDVFIDEVKENTQRFNEGLLALEETPDKVEILDEIFRSAHNIKGISQTMQFSDLANLAHSMENVLVPLRDGVMNTESGIIDLMFKCLDRIDELVNLVIQGTYTENKVNIEDLMISLKEVSTKLSGKMQVVSSCEVNFNEFEMNLINKAVQNNLKPFKIYVSIEDDSSLPAARAYMVLNEIAVFGEIIKSNPDILELKQGNFDKLLEVYLLTQKTNNEISKCLSQIQEVKDIVITELKLNQDNSLSATENQPVKDSKPEEELTKNNPTNKTLQPMTVPSTIRVNADKIDELLNLVGELIFGKTRMLDFLSDIKSDKITDLMDFCNNTTSNIQNIVMKLRMISMDQVFNRYPRMIRDISKKQNKEINLVLTGKKTEIDKVIADEINDPLIHLIKNSIDHGIETPEERIKANKPSKGTLELAAFNEGDNTIIKISDDGRGIDPEEFLKIAVQKGLIKEEDAPYLSKKEIMDLIFLPGFSTKQAATDISGRGVGLDIVKSKVSLLGGNVLINSEVGTGTTITVVFPSTMAIVQTLLVKVEDEIYAAPLNYVNEIIEIDKTDIRIVQNKEVFVFRGQVLPIKRLDKILNVNNTVNEDNKRLTLMIIKCQNKYQGIVISEFAGQQEVVIKPINKKINPKKYFLGATTLGNGKVVLILNINELF